ncbi:MAG: preprotein translocase subunit SecG [Ruminococcaceae bacterium]|nr:preprotein translocase subunit SecG [Oscillospiraceae bacterium]
MKLIFGIVLLVMAIFLIAAVLMQSGKDKRLSGTIAGGAETFFGKSKASKMEKTISNITTVVSIIFAILVVVMYVIIA